MSNPIFDKPLEKNVHTIAFYNVENLFNINDDPNVLDDDFTVDGVKKWGSKRYADKINKIAMTISEIGTKNTQRPPVLMGIVEVENKDVVKDVIHSEHLRKWDYGVVHFDSPDERGIDNALIFQKRHFELRHAEPIPLLVGNTNGEMDKTRDILYVHGKLNNEEVHVFVNHWPSRREGEALTEHKRIKASETVKGFVKKLKSKTSHPITSLWAILTMGRMLPVFDRSWKWKPCTILWHV